MSGDERLILLQERLDNHIAVYEEHRCEEQVRWKNLIMSQETNTKSLQDLTDSTRDLVEVWQAADGTMKTMSTVGRFAKWLSSFAIVGVLFTWVADHFT